MRRKRITKRSRKGMAMLMVLFIVMAIAIISAGFIARSNTALACGRNYRIRNEADYAAWGALEAGWALVQDPNNIPYDQQGQSVDWGGASNLKYDLAIGSGTATADPNVFVYPVTAEAYQWVNDERRATSRLYGDLKYDTDLGTGYYILIRRTE